MISSRVNFNEMVKNLVPGSIVVAGGWYLFRPLLEKVFPFITNDILSWSYQPKMLTFVFLSLVIGIFYDSISDIAVSIVSDDARNS